MVAAAALVHGGAVGASFISLDDDIHVYGNSHVMAGITAGGVAWSFRLGGGGTYFHPLTWLSLMLDRTIFGPEPWGFHLVNVLLHAANAVLLLLVLHRATTRLAPSAGAALLFAVHPLGVEAVAWVTERKTLLAAFLGLGAVLAHVAYAARPSLRRLAVVTALLAASLLAKPSFVTMPLLLLAMDVWPLRRLRPEGRSDAEAERFPRTTLRAALLEKVPLAAACAASLAVSLLSTQEPPGGPVPASAVSATGFDLPLGLRAANAIASIPRYLAAAAWPAGLSALHPFPVHVPAARAVAGAAIVLAMTAVAVAGWRRSPWFLSGWAWFLAALAPTLGLAQAGLWPGWAERFAYLALIGLAFAASFAVAALAERSRTARIAACAVSGAALVALALAARAQVAFWRDSETLFRHAVEVEPLAPEMHYKLGETLMDAGRLDEAERALAEAVRLAPWQPWAQSRLGALRLRRGLVGEAEAAYREAIRWDPNCPDALIGLARLLREAGRGDEARPFFARYAAVRADPSRPR